MLRLVTHGFSAFVATLAFFVLLAVAGWIAIGYGVAIIVGILALIYAAIAIPLLVMYYDESNPSGGRYPDALH